MEHTKLPMRIWFLAIYLASLPKTRLSALALECQLGVGYPIVWLLHRKRGRAMAQQESVRQLSGIVQFDNWYLSGERHRDKADRD